MRKLYKTIILSMIILVLVSPVIASDNRSISNNTMYRVLIDQNYGFFRAFEMYDKILGKEIDQTNRTLNISKGDTVTFVSDTIPDRLLTIISKEKLWSEKNGTLKYGGKEFSHIFNKSGIYNVYVKERPHLKQEIIVGPIDLNATNITSINDTIQNQTNVTNTNETKSNSTIGTELNRTNVTNTNDTQSNLTTNSSRNNTAIIKQNSTTNKPNSVPTSVKLAGSLFSKIKSKSDTFILSTVLLVIYVLSGRIKEN